MQISDLVVKSTGFVLKILEGIFKDKVTVSGVENIPDNPVLFTANHFTRLETLILPYFIHKHTGKLARSLADKKLFKGALGDYLTKTGTLPTDNPNRNEIIVGDLIAGDNNWIIYPEGNMMKNKKSVLKGRKFQLHLATETRDIFTGSAVMAIKSQLIREDLLKSQKPEVMEKFFIQERGVSYLPTAVVPINITYYPLRCTTTKIEQWVRKFVENLSPRFEEEMEIEASILAHANIHIHFCEPIYLHNMLSGSKLINMRMPLINREKQHDFIINYYRHRLTNKFMSKVYENTFINIDHILAITLMNHQSDDIHARELRSRVYLNIKHIDNLGKYRLHPSCKVDAFKILAGRNYPPLKKAMELAFEEKALIGSMEYEFLQVDHNHLNNEYDFHTIRQKNLLKVFANELANQPEIMEIVKNNAKRSIKNIDEEIFGVLFQKDIDNYSQDYKKYSSEFSKNYDIGKPFFLQAADRKVGVVLSHGYKAAPEEVKQLAEYLHKNGISVYGVRLHGHGTAPINLKHTSWLKWYDSYMRGVVSTQKMCDKVFFMGFSTGGLLSLYAAAKNATKCDGVISINSALKLKDIRARIIKFVNVWDDLITRFRQGKGAVEFIDDIPENPDINYSRNYLKGVEELGKLMRHTKESLEQVHSPALVIQSPSDPIVNPESGDIIFNTIHSRHKEIIKPSVANHVIIRGDVEEAVFKPILDFIKKNS